MPLPDKGRFLRALWRMCWRVAVFGVDSEIWGSTNFCRGVLINCLSERSWHWPVTERGFQHDFMPYTINTVFNTCITIN